MLALLARGRDRVPVHFDRRTAGVHVEKERSDYFGPVLAMGHGEYEDKCDFTANQFENAAFGWSSTTRKVGFWFLSPSVEYEDVHMNAASVTRMRVGLSHPAYT